MSNEINEKWLEIKEMLSLAEEDIEKNSRGNKAAGARARKKIRALRNELSLLIKLSLAKSKE